MDRSRARAGPFSGGQPGGWGHPRHPEAIGSPVVLRLQAGVGRVSCAGNILLRVVLLRRGAGVLIFFLFFSFFFFAEVRGLEKGKGKGRCQGRRGEEQGSCQTAEGTLSPGR